ncbi:hypothetical protein R1flu_016854 [Riccia fluitans]|uniref:Uncharacterized protein n=1 Tax=Riccia fluitans TaxID=41844 RepID=A0ABD1YNK3_9MARC
MLGQREYSLSLAGGKEKSLSVLGIAGAASEFEKDDRKRPRTLSQQVENYIDLKRGFGLGVLWDLILAV